MKNMLCYMQTKLSAKKKLNGLLYKGFSKLLATNPTIGETGTRRKKKAQFCSY